VFDLLLLWSEFSVGIYGNIPEDLEVLNLIMFGPFWWVFWFVQLIFGAIVPLIIMFLPATRRSIHWMGFAGLMIVIGIVGVRLNIVIPALSIPVLPGLAEAYTVLPAPTQAPLAYPVEAIQWLDRLAVVAAIVTVLVFAYIALRRLQKQEEHRLQRALVRFSFVTGIFIVAILVINWVGGLPISALDTNLINSPLNGIFGHTELTSYYIPSPNEWLSSAGMIGVSILLFIFGYKYLPLETEEEH
jgi:Ni/Fe-hydrogenase subunit HybB-like protein